MSDHYQTLNGYMGRPVEVRTMDGNTHRGIVDSIDDDKVYLQPLGGGPEGSDQGGAYGYGSYFFFFPGAALVAVSLATILAVSLIWWW